MATTIRTNSKVATKESINDFSLRHGVTLPVEYCSMLLSSNGGEAKPDGVVIRPGVETVVQELFGLFDGPGGLDDAVRNCEGQIPSGFLPIGEDPGGNLFLMGVTNENLGRIYFWSHDDTLDDEGLSKTDLSNMSLLSLDFQEFLDSLQEFDD